MEAKPNATWVRVSEIIEKDTDDLVNLCLLLSGIPSPAGKERKVCEAVVAWFKSAGIRSWTQRITEDSANAVAQIKGSGNGKSLIFDAHLDTGAPGSVGRGDDAKRMETGFAEKGMLYGWGIVNDKAQVAAFMIAARALHKAGIQLGGDLTVVGAAFETGDPSVDEFQGIDRPGEGFGSRWLIDRGIVADYALVGETTNFGLVTVECGYVQLKIEVYGRPLYTPRLVRGKAWHESPNAFEKAGHIVQALEEWAIRYEEREKTPHAGGVINPKAQILGIRGNGPSGLNGDTCQIYLEVWILPGRDPRAVLSEIRVLVQNFKIDHEVSMYHWSRGYYAKNAELLIDSIRQAHSYLFGTEPPAPPSATLSMWRDINAFNEVGIPSICYGPARQKEMYTYEQNRAMKISDLVAATKVYALTAMSICGAAKKASQ